MNRPRVLIIDDEPSNLGLLRQILKEEYNLFFAKGGEEGLAAVGRHEPALILLDVRMPDMDGYEVCRRLKADPAYAGIPVLFITASDNADSESQGFEAGGVDYIYKPVCPSTVRARVRNHLSLVRLDQLERSYRTAIVVLSEGGHYNGTDTGVHIWRMAAYARALADAVGWSPEQSDLLELAAPMHDMGKIGIPDHILKKPGPLTEEEWAIMRTHPRIGYEILKRSDGLIFRMAAEIALHHHEKWDGSGYPAGETGEGIPEASRIVAIADVFDALSVRRPYKDPWPLEQVLATMRDGAGQHFDPRLLARFLEIMPEILRLKTQWDTREARGDYQIGCVR